MRQLYYVTGFMGSGKTTVGQTLGKAIGYAVEDTDEWIERTQQRKIRELFREHGEAYFAGWKPKLLDD